MADTIAPRPSTAGAARIGGPGDVLSDDEVRTFVHDQLDAADLDGRSVCVLVPDTTRTCPLPVLLSAVHGALHGRALGHADHGSTDRTTPPWKEREARDW